MIELKNIKVCPTYNPNFKITNIDKLADILPSTPIVINFDNYYNFWLEDTKIIGMVSPHGNLMDIEDDFIVANVLIEKEYKDYVFDNYECTIGEYNKETKEGEIKKINVIGFKNKESD